MLTARLVRPSPSHATKDARCRATLQWMVAHTRMAITTSVWWVRTRWATEWNSMSALSQRPHLPHRTPTRIRGLRAQPLPTHPSRRDHPRPHWLRRYRELTPSSWLTILCHAPRSLSLSTSLTTPSAQASKECRLPMFFGPAHLHI